MSGILAVLEQREGQLHKMALEALAAAQKLGAELGAPVYAALLGTGADAAAQIVAQYELAGVHVLGHHLLAEYTPDGYTLALRQLIEAHNPTYVLFAHTYQVRDFAPRLATALNRVLVSDVVGHRAENGAVVLVRQMFQGKIAADVHFNGEGPFFRLRSGRCFPG